MQKWCICLFCEGHDDNSKNSQTNMEARYQEKDTTTLKIIFWLVPGADQLALLLIARYHVESNKLHPTFGILYPLGRGEDTIPSYENQPIGKPLLSIFMLLAAASHKAVTGHHACG